MECIKQDPVSLNRILWLDALKCFAMFLVIWGHVIQYGVTDYLENDIHIGIYSFHMPLFFMVSGLFIFRGFLLNLSPPSSPTPTGCPVEA